MTRPDTTRNGWHVARGAASYTLARQWPPRFDVAAQSTFPAVRMGRLAHQVRQDLWRMMRGLRGFSPVVVIAATDVGLSLRAGGRASAPVPAGTEDRIAALLDCPAHRARWVAHAGLDAQSWAGFRARERTA